MKRAAVLLFVFAGVAAQAVDTQALLAKAFSPSKAAYACEQETEVTVEGGSAHSQVKLSCNGKGAVRREYDLGDGKRLTLLQIGRLSWQYDGSSWVQLPESAAENATDAAKQIARNYTVTAEAAVLMAGRKVVPLVLKPKRDFCPLRRLWVDASTGIVFKDKLFAPDGRLRSSTTTSTVRYGPQPSELFEKPAKFSTAEQFGPSSFRSMDSKAQVEKATGRTVPTPTHVPAGFSPVVYGIMTTGGSFKMPAVRYSDGLASFTVFERRQGRNGRGRGWQGGRAQDPSSELVSDIQRSVVQIRGRRNYILIGDISESELQKVANSLK